MTKLMRLMEEGPVAINLGLQEFAQSLKAQGKPIIHVEWSPPAPVDEAMRVILDKLL